MNKIDTTPSISIYKIFKNITYKLPEALAEFIDNSTQAFKDNISLINDPNFVPKICIIYTCNKNEEKIQILDNCFGVSSENLEKVLKLNLPNRKINSRNKFGMGLKTASFWFGNNLTITTRNFQEDITRVINFNLNNLDQYVDNKVLVKNYNAEYFFNTFDEHYGTHIQISNLTKKCTRNKLEKTIKILAAKFANDILDNNLKIKFVWQENKNTFLDINNSFNAVKNVNDLVPISFSPPKLKRDDKNREIKINIDKTFYFDNKNWSVKGWIGILEKGSRNSPGITLFQNKRAVLGDSTENMYKPYKIFKDAASFEYQRICGWLDVDDFPITQQKNNFIWDDGLEDSFLDFLYNEIINNPDFNLIKIAKTTKERKSHLQKNDIFNNNVGNDIKESINQNSTLFVNKFELKDENTLTFHLDSRKNKFIDNIPNNIVLNVKYSNENQWLSISSVEGKKNEYDLKINFELEFFSPFNNELENVKDQIILFIVYFAYAEIKHRISCDNFGDIRNTLNEIMQNKEKTPFRIESNEFKKK